MAEPIGFWDLPSEDVYDLMRDGQRGSRFPHYLIAFDAWVSDAALVKLGYRKAVDFGGGLRAVVNIGQTVYYPWLGDLTAEDVEFALNYRHEFK